MTSITLLFSLLAQISQAENNFSTIDRYVMEIKKQTDFPSGTGIAIVKDGKVVYEGYFGYSDIEKNTEVSKNTAFYIASITKPIFVLTALLLEEKEEINTQASLAEMFPKLDFRHIDATKITWEHLIGHTSGIANKNLTVVTAYSGIHDNQTLHDIINQSTQHDSIKLGQFKYTNIGYNIMSVWLDDRYQGGWQQVMNQTVFKPLGMHQTSTFVSPEKNNHLEIAQPYSFYNEIKARKLYLQKRDNTMHAAGGIVTTATDLAKFLIVQLNHGTINGRAVFSKEVIEKSKRKLASFEGSYGDFERTAYAWGWNIGPYKNEKMYHHFGGFPGSSPHVSFIPSKNIGLVVLNNEHGLSKEVNNAIADLAYSILLEKGDPEIILQDRIKLTLAQVKKNQEGMALHKKKMLARTMVLSLDKAEYEGVYSNPLMGDVTVKLNDSNQFNIMHGNLNATAIPYKEADSMRVEFLPVWGGDVIRYSIQQHKVVGLRLFDNDFDKNLGK